VIVRKSGVERRDERSIARPPFAKRVSSSVASTSTSLGTTPYATRRSRKPRSASWASGVSSVNRVGSASSSTSSPPFDQTNGAMRITLGSTPSPYTAAVAPPESGSPATIWRPFASRVSAAARPTIVFHVQSSSGSGTPYLANRSRL
jgi:hypothetical protein